VITCQRRIGRQRCGQPVPDTRQDRGPWLCDPCLAVCNRTVDGVYTACTPMVADVLQTMQKHHISQSEAVRRLGGIP
jgi:hypothetical protein